MPFVFRIQTGLCVALLAGSAAVATAQQPANDRSQRKSDRQNVGKERQGQPNDVLCELLMQQYILARGKIQTDDVKAAIRLVASRGRNNGYWRIVLKEFEKSCDANERIVTANTLAVLTGILSYGGRARWQFERKQTGQASLPSPGGAQTPYFVGPEVLQRVIARAGQADKREIDSFVIAVRQSHDTRSKQFLLDVLRGTKTEGSWSDARYLAAVGLAELGVHEGVEWLIAYSDVPAARSDVGDIDINRAPHRYAPRNTRFQCCRRAMADLTGQPPTLTKARWKEWWAANRTDFVPKSFVSLRIR